MDWFVPLVLVVQAGFVLSTGYEIALAKPRLTRARPRYLYLGFLMLVGAFMSWGISENHPQAPGAVLARFGSAVLVGMALVLLMSALRERRGVDKDQNPST
jgi:hypothetical protein